MPLVWAEGSHEIWAIDENLNELIFTSCYMLELF